MEIGAETAGAEAAFERATRYRELKVEIESIVRGEPSHTARYASAACLLAHAFAPRFFWTGFYLVDPNRPDELVVGPYQGTLGCLRIPFGKGVCGTAAARRETQLVANVHEFPGHIACDARSQSEIVAPVFDAEGRLAAVLDVDSERLNAFDAVDQAGLEAICGDLLTV